MKTLIFSLIILLSSVCYGQVPITKDKVLILVTNHDSNSLYQDAERNFTALGVREYIKQKGIQFIRVYGDDLTQEWRVKHMVTHYPAIVYFMKQDGQYVLAKTVSGPEASRALGKADRVRYLLGMKAQTTPQQQVVPNNPLIPGPQPQPPVQYVSPPQQYIQPPQQFMNQWGSAQSSS